MSFARPDGIRKVTLLTQNRYCCYKHASLQLKVLQRRSNKVCSTKTWLQGTILINHPEDHNKKQTPAASFSHTLKALVMEKKWKQAENVWQQM